MSSNQEPVHMPVLILHSDESWKHILTEFVSWEGYETRCAATAVEAFTVLDGHAGKFIVLMDNFVVQPQCQEFFEELRHRPDVRARVKVVGISSGVGNERIRREYGDVVDAYLDIIFHIRDLYNTLASL